MFRSHKTSREVQRRLQLSHTRPGYDWTVALGKAVLLCSGGQGKMISAFQAAILEYRARPCLQKAVQKTTKYKDYNCKSWQRRVGGKLAMMEFHVAGDVWINIDCKV